MNHSRRFTAEKIGRRIRLAERMIHRAALPFAPFRYRALPDARTPPPLDADAAGWPEIPWESYWAGQDQNFHLRSEICVPAGWAEGPVALHLPMGVAGDIFTHPEALLYVDGRPYASADRYHHTIYLPDGIADGLPHRIDLHGWSGLTGWPPDPADGRRLFMATCRVVEIHEATRDFLDRAEVALEVARALDEGRPEKMRILNALDAAFLALDTRDPMGDAFYRSLPRAAEALERGLAAAGAPLDVTLHAIGHAHMDVAYLWPVDQIRRKNARTYSNVLRLMERFPDYTFSHSQPQLYEYTRTDYPEIFEAIRARVAEGRWEVMGGMWVEPDTNIPGGESLVRQLLLGRCFFAAHFGQAETPVLWLPDVFGLTWCLPQLMAQAGLRWLVTNKPSWNQYNQMPASTTWWEGLDGTRVLAHFLTTPREVQHLPFPTNYKSDLSAAEVIGTWTGNTVKEHLSELPIAYGYGDGGGGPTGALIRRAGIFADMPGAPRTKCSTVRAFFDAAERAAPRLPVWAGELYLEGHRGVLTSQAWIKRANRHAETALHEAEFLAARAVLDGHPAPRETLTAAWRRLCMTQFHDILPGTSVGKVFEDARHDFAQVRDAAEAVAAEALARLGAGTGALHLVNPAASGADRQVVVPGDAAEVPGDGPRQRVAEGTLVHMAHALPYSLVPLRAETPRRPASARTEGAATILENGILRLEFDASGDLVSLRDLEAGREVLAEGLAGNRLQAFEDRPISWDAWDIDAFFEDRGEVVGGLTRLEIVEDRPLRATLLVERNYRTSRILQRIRLCADSRRVDFVTEVDWHETHILLKVAFPVRVLSPVATYEIQWGSIERPTHRNTLWDYAKFEVPAQRWADLSEGDYGVALLNDCKYGYDIRGNVLRLSLIKSATMPDPGADQGRHDFTYALYPHPGDWRRGVIPAAHALNARPRLARLPEAALGRLVSADRAGFVVETVKPAEDGRGVVLRGYEAHRTRGPVTLAFDRRYSRIERTEILERGAELLAEDADAVTLEVAPFEIVTLRLLP